MHTNKFLRKLKTKKQIELAEYLLFTGLSAKDIGLELGLAESTIQNRANILYERLEYKSRSHMQADYINFLEGKIDELNQAN